MTIMIKHSKDLVSKALTTSEASTPKIEIGEFSSGVVFIPAGETVVTLTFYAAPNSGGTHLPMYDSAGVAITLTVANTRCYPLPASIFGAANIKIVANVACTAHFSFKS